MGDFLGLVDGFVEFGIGKVCIILLEIMVEGDKVFI